MKTVTWREAFELVGIVAVVASLVFVGLQLQQSHEIALAEIYQMRTSTVADLNLEMAANPLIVAAHTKRNDDRLAEIDAAEQYAASRAMLADLMLLENSHFQYSLGFLPEDHWLRVRDNIKGILQDPLNGPLLRDWMWYARGPFKKAIEEIQLELESESGA